MQDALQSHRPEAGARDTTAAAVPDHEQVGLGGLVEEDLARAPGTTRTSTGTVRAAGPTDPIASVSACRAVRSASSANSAMVGGTTMPPAMP